MLVVADAFHQAPHEVAKWEIAWLYKAYSFVTYRNEQSDPKNQQAASKSGETFSGQDIADWN